MSIVLAYKTKDLEGFDKIYLVADSQSVYGRSVESLSNRNNFRVWKVPGTKDCYMGGVGVQREICCTKNTYGIIRESDLIKSKVNFNYIVNHSEPVIRDSLMDHKIISKVTPYKDMNSKYILVVEDKIYSICYGNITEHDDYAVIGTGDCQIAACFEMNEHIQDPLERILTSFKTVAKQNIYFNYPLVCMDCTENQTYIINEEKLNNYISDQKEEN